MRLSKFGGFRSRRNISRLPFLQLHELKRAVKEKVFEVWVAQMGKNYDLWAKKFSILIISTYVTSCFQATYFDLFL